MHDNKTIEWNPIHIFMQGEISIVRINVKRKRKHPDAQPRVTMCSQVVTKSLVYIYLIKLLLKVFTRQGRINTKTKKNFKVKI